MIYQRLRWRRSALCEGLGNMAPGLAIDATPVPHRAERSDNNKGADA